MPDIYHNRFLLNLIQNYEDGQLLASQQRFISIHFMEVLLDLFKILVPAALVLYAMYLIVKSFLDKELQKQVIATRDKNTEIVLPARLQAYERMVLFLERITPNHLLRRLNMADLSAKEFQHVLVHEIREEFNHNLSQQVYMSDKSWHAIRQAMEETIVLINQSADDLPPDARSIELNRLLLKRMAEEDTDPTGRALKTIKDEIRSVF